MQERFQEYFKSSQRLIDKIINDSLIYKRLVSAVAAIERCLMGGGKVVVAGNGGSAADAQHFAAELVGRFLHNRQALSAIALTTDTSNITAIGNDFGFEHIFSRQVEALARPGDVFLGISTSGNSQNIVNAVAACMKRGITTIGLLGGYGGVLKDMVDIPLIVPHEKTPKIQEMHITMIHFICWELERSLSKEYKQ